MASYALPCHWFVPPLVMTFTEERPLPYCAGALLVLILTSEIESIGRMLLLLLKSRGAVAAEPSSRKFMLYPWVPFTPDCWPGPAMPAPPPVFTPGII